MEGAEDSLELLTEAIKQAGYTGKVQIGIDCASSEFYKDGKYDLDFKVLSTHPRHLWARQLTCSVLRTPTPTRARS